MVLTTSLVLTLRTWRAGGSRLQNLQPMHNLQKTPAPLGVRA